MNAMNPVCDEEFFCEDFIFFLLYIALMTSNIVAESPLHKEYKSGKIKENLGSHEECCKVLLEKTLIPPQAKNPRYNQETFFEN